MSSASGESLLVSAAIPPLSGVTDQLEPGATASLTLRFVEKGIVSCDAVTHDANGDAVPVAGVSLTLR